MAVNGYKRWKLGSLYTICTPSCAQDRLEGHRRHRLLDEHGTELRCFHDDLPEAARELLTLLGVDQTPYGLADS